MVICCYYNNKCLLSWTDSIQQGALKNIFNLNLKVHVSNVINYFKNEWGWCFKQHTVLLIMLRDMICVGELWLTKRSYAHRGLWDNELATILKKPLLAYSPISHARSK